MKRQEAGQAAASNKSGMQLREAQELANEMLAAMAPFCERIVVAGSIRREKPAEIKDVEIVARPRFGPDGANLLYAWALSDESLIDSPLQRWIKTGRAESEPPDTDGESEDDGEAAEPLPAPWEPKAEGRYWRGLLRGNIKLDLFIPLPESWGAQLLVRTGPAKFNASLFSHARRSGHLFDKGRLWSNAWRGTPPAEWVAVDTSGGEEIVFRVLGLAYVPPPERLDRQSLRALAGKKRPAT